MSFPSSKSRSPRKPVTPEAARLRMADLCSRIETSSFEVREKLTRMNLPSSEINAILRYLEENKFINDARYARAFANDKMRFAGWGPMKIRMGLTAKRIPSPLIAEALEELEEEEFLEVALKAGRQKARSLNLQLREDAIKLYRFLAQRGFTSSQASRTLTTLRKEASGEE